MAYKYAMAYLATGDERHAELALRVVGEWARTNTVFGLKGKNGPLEAGWCARRRPGAHGRAAHRRRGGRAASAPAKPRRNAPKNVSKRARAQGRRRDGARDGGAARVLPKV